MKYVNVNGLELSRFSLGTVQLGMDYGLGEYNKKPTQERAFSMLDQAMELGVNNLDTANNYGDSEALIGRWIARRREEKKTLPWVVTKIGPMRHSSFDALRDDVLRQVENSQKNLGSETIDCLMLHDFEDYAKDPDAMRKIFQELKTQKAYHYSAISAYSRHDYSMIADSGFDATQIPLNVFDWTQILNGGIEKLAKANMMVFVRSVFLQGLVFLKPEEVDPRMRFCVPYVEKFQKLCREFQLSPAVLALSFVFSLPGITTTVLGCQINDHVKSNCELMDQVTPLSQEQMDELRDAFWDTDPTVTNPGLWFNHT